MITRDYTVEDLLYCFIYAIERLLGVHNTSPWFWTTGKSFDQWIVPCSAYENVDV